MGYALVRGIKAAMLVTVVVLIVGIVINTMGWQGLSMSLLVDIGLILSCIMAGYVAGRDSTLWILGGLASLCYVALLIGVIALFLKIDISGAVQILGQGGLIGLLAGAFGGGQGKSPIKRYGASRRSFYDYGYYDDRDVHLDAWRDLDYEDEWVGSSKKNKKDKIIWSQSKEDLVKNKLGDEENYWGRYSDDEYSKIRDIEEEEEVVEKFSSIREEDKKDEDKEGIEKQVEQESQVDFEAYAREDVHEKYSGNIFTGKPKEEEEKEFKVNRRAWWEEEVL